MSCFLGIDVGTSGIKAIVLGDNGRILGIGSAECHLITPQPNWAEQDVFEWWNACNSAAMQAVAQSGRGMDIAGIGFSGQMQGCVLLDKNMDPIGNCMIWLDQRAAHEADELNSRLSDAEKLGITGNYCLPSFWAAKLLWLKRNREADFNKINTVLFPKDYLRFRLTGEAAAEVSDASLSWLLDLNKRCWSDRMFEVTGLSKSIFPAQLLESQDVAGYLRQDVANAWGLKPGIPIAAGGGDQPVGGIGSGIIRPGSISATIGTSGVVFGCCETPFIDYKPRAMNSLCHSVPQLYSFLGCTLGAGGSFKWLRDTVFADEKELFAAKGEDIYDHMTILAEKAPVGCDGLCFLPYLNGEATPHGDPDARGVFFGLSYRHGLDSICRSVMEGVAFSLLDIISIIQEINKVEFTEVRVAGGGAKSALWRQIQADIFNTVVVSVNMEECAATGAAILGAVAAGAYQNIAEACGAILKTTDITEPIPNNVDIYRDYYHMYQSLYPLLKESFSVQSDNVKKILTKSLSKD